MLVTAGSACPELSRVLQIVIQTIRENPCLTLTTEKQITKSVLNLKVFGNTCTVLCQKGFFLCGSMLDLQMVGLQNIFEGEGPSV